MPKLHKNVKRLKFIYIQLKNYFFLFRVYQYIKNLLIFVPLIFALKIDNLDLTLKCIFVFLCFSIVASSVYIFNDLCDIELDRLHKTKKNRPIASGTISRHIALFFIPALVIIGCVIMSLFSIEATICTIFYYFLNISYSIKLKNIAIVDVLVIAIGFIIRLFIGALVVGVHLTGWLILITFVFALFIALAKRRDDILNYHKTGIKNRKVVDGYNLEFLNCSIGVMASITIICYAIYTVSPDITSKFHSNNLYLTVFFVIAGFLRYLQITFVLENRGSPTKVCLSDIPIIFVCIAWLATFIYLIY